NNMPPKRSSATARAAAAPMTVAAVEQLIEVRVYALLAHHLEMPLHGRTPT
ncbi:hypothetical protein Tco_0632117, partial [Tanacetum coccineum]